MEIIKQSRVWWGPPRKFSTQIELRKISWLELFYDLVYVVIISNITGQLIRHPGTTGLIDYIYFFIMIYWGWLNGSLYHDLHGSEGLRTRLMTLWQMIVVSALVITINTAGENLLIHATITIMIMQIFITYLWWSVGFYDKAHRRLNRPYTVLYLTSFTLMLITLFIRDQYLIRILFFITLVFNYIPPFVVHGLFRSVSSQLDLSPSMTERMGLFAIIMFGEVVLGVINGVSRLGQTLDLKNWIQFGLAIIIVFSLWWIFFILCSDRKCKSGFVNSSLMQIIYVPTLMSMGFIGAGFSSLFAHFGSSDPQYILLFKAFQISLGIFFMGISGIMLFLEYPENYVRLTVFTRHLLLIAAVVFFILALPAIHETLINYLLLVLGVIITLIVVMNFWWYSIFLKEGEVKETGSNDYGLHEHS
jgi:low temperature requirement protein LtrA